MMKDRCAVRSGVSLLLLAALLLAGCGTQPPPSTSPATMPPTPTTDPVTATLSSLEKVDEYPFYIMRFFGDYPAAISTPENPARAGWGCSLFAALGDPGSRLYGRNFDWEFSPALLLFTAPEDGYASVSMVDLTFLGIDAATARRLDGMPLSERGDLLAAPLLPFDGMNEKGLAIGMAAVPGSQAGTDPGKPVIGSLGIMRQVLDHARDVGEAVELFSQYNIDFSGGPPIHYLLADASGQAALIEYVDGEMVVLMEENPWHLATNHLRQGVLGDGGCDRYHTLEDRLREAQGSLEIPAAMDLLQGVSQPGSTQWSVVYHLLSGEVWVALGRGYDDIYMFQLDPGAP